MLAFQFHSGRDGQPVLKVTQAGAAFGLHVILNVRQDDYYGADGYLAGLKILIHDPDTPPMVDELGFAVGPGMSSFAAIRKQKVSQQAWACGRASESVSAREYGHGSQVSGLLLHKRSPPLLNPSVYKVIWFVAFMPLLTKFRTVYFLHLDAMNMQRDTLWSTREELSRTRR